MPENSLVPIGLDGYIVFFSVLAVVMVTLFWFLQRRERQLRRQFFGKFKTSELRMSPYKIGLVYRVIENADNMVLVVPIWSGKSQIIKGKEQALDPGHLIPFDETRFF